MLEVLKILLMYNSKKIIAMLHNCSNFRYLFWDTDISSLRELQRKEVECCLLQVLFQKFQMLQHQPANNLLLRGYWNRRGEEKFKKNENIVKSKIFEILRNAVSHCPKILRQLEIDSSGDANHAESIQIHIPAISCKGLLTHNGCP